MSKSYISIGKKLISGQIKVILGFITKWNGKKPHIDTGSPCCSSNQSNWFCNLSFIFKIGDWIPSVAGYHLLPCMDLTMSKTCWAWFKAWHSSSEIIQNIFLLFQYSVCENISSLLICWIVTKFYMFIENLIC